MSPQAGSSENNHPRHRLDPVIHSPVRLSVMACLAAADRAEFGFIRDTVEVSDSVLSKQIANLQDAGYLKVKKGYVGKYPRTWLSLTAAGRRALDAHLEALTAIVNSQQASAITGVSDRSQGRAA